MQQICQTYFYNFYASLKLQKSNNYLVQTLKCLQSGLAHHFRSVKGFDISKDSANVMCKAVTAHSKKQWERGSLLNSKMLQPIDIERIAEYFNYNHMVAHHPKNLIF